ncbi:Metallo-beta-lactamase superfamily exported protein, partial [human gut metagenome]
EELPDEDTIKLLNKYNVKNFLTKDGEIVVKTDGNNISISQ